MVGFNVGNIYDTVMRTVARHIGKHIPGNPTVIPVNRPGAGSLAAANQVFNASPRDGTVIGVFNRSIPTEPLLGVERGGQIRRHQVHLDRQCRQRGQRLRRAQADRREDLERFHHQADAGRRDIDQRRHRRLSAAAEQHVRRQAQARHRLSGRRGHDARARARRGRRPLRLVARRHQDRAPDLAQGRPDQHPGAARPARQPRPRRRSADHGHGEERPAAPHPEAHHQPAGAGLYVCRAARIAGRQDQRRCEPRSIGP